MWANSNQLADLILLHWKSLQVWWYCWNARPGTKNIENRCMKIAGGCQKRLKTHLALLWLLTWKKRQWNSALRWYVHRDLEAWGSLLGQEWSWATLPPPSPCQPGRFCWAVLTSHYHVLSPLNGHLNSGISIETDGSVAKLPASTLFSTSHFSRPSSLLVSCATQKWFNTCEGLINQWLTGNWAFLGDFCTVPKG